tara:strand:- start:3390 stop:3842 length:453 start_codon:yes stop_codon:yes gene_type:complete
VAEDVLQETFVALLKLREIPQQPEFYETRAYRNKTFTFKRSIIRRFKRESEAENWLKPGETDDPEEAVAIGALKGLPPNQREVIVLNIWHRHTFEQIGTLLKTSPNTVAARYRYGMQKLKQTLESLRNEEFEKPRIPDGWLDTPAGHATS